MGDSRTREDFTAHGSARRVVARGLRRLRRLFDWQPLRASGALVAVCGVLAVRELGKKRQDLVLYVVGYGVVGVVLLAVMAVAATTLDLFVATRPLRAPPAAPGARVTRVEAESPFSSGFSLPALGWLPIVSLRWEWVTPSEVDLSITLRGSRFVESVRFRERGEHAELVRRVVVEDVFGMARLGFLSASRSALFVVPASGRPLSAPLLEALGGGDLVSHPAGPPEGDLIEMRAYAPGDPMKRVLWKTFAKSRNLMVRLPERAIAPTRRTLAYLVADRDDEAAASIARVALESGALGTSWRFGADGSLEQAERVEEALPLIVRSRAARARAGLDLRPFLERCGEVGAARLVLFAPASPGRWLAPVCEQIKRRARGVEVVLGIDGLAEESEARKWNSVRFWLWRSHGTEGQRSAHDLEKVAERLTASGAAVTVVDRRSGRVAANIGRRGPIRRRGFA